MYMALPKGIEARYGKRKVLKLHKNLYGQKQAGLHFHHFARDNLFKIGWNQSKIDECIFYKDSIILLMYVDDLIIFNKSNDIIDKQVKDMQRIFKMEDLGNVDEYLGVKVQGNDNKIYLTQPQLIQQIIDDVKLPKGSKPVSIPAMPTKTLMRSIDEPPHDPQ